MSYLESEPNSVQRKFRQAHIERRLRIASAARVDRPINLKFKNGIDPSIVKRIEIKSVDKEQENINSIHIKELMEKCIALELQYKQLMHKFFPLETAPDTPEPTILIRKPSVAEIIKEVALFSGFTRLDILSPRREKEVCRARQISVYLAKKFTLRSFPELGRIFGRDHSTLVHSSQKIERNRAIDPILDDNIKELELRISIIASKTAL